MQAAALSTLPTVHYSHLPFPLPLPSNAVCIEAWREGWRTRSIRATAIEDGRMRCLAGWQTKEDTKTVFRSSLRELNGIVTDSSPLTLLRCGSKAVSTLVMPEPLRLQSGGSCETAMEGSGGGLPLPFFAAQCGLGLLRFAWLGLACLGSVSPFAKRRNRALMRQQLEGLLRCAVSNYCQALFLSVCCVCAWQCLPLFCPYVSMTTIRTLQSLLTSISYSFTRACQAQTPKA